MQLVDKYRPRSIDDIAGNAAVVKQIQFLMSRGSLGGQGYWISGPSAVGKSSAAAIISQAVCGTHWGESTETARSLTPNDVADWTRKLRCKPIGGNGWCLTINEAHGMRKDTVEAFLDLLDPETEQLPSYAAVVFTSSAKGRQKLFDDCDDAGPLLSRCKRFDMTFDLIGFASRCRYIATTEGLEAGQTLSEYIAGLKRHDCNMRSFLQEIECGCFAGETVTA